MGTKKYEIIERYEHSIEWVRNLQQLSESKWRKPIAEGKWTIAEVVGHLIPWDQFVIENRIPYFFQNKELPKSPIVSEVNGQAAHTSRIRSKEETIEAFISCRKVLLEKIQTIDDSLWGEEITIGKTKLTLYQYFSGLLEHDEHHFQQITNALSKVNPL